MKVISKLVLSVASDLASATVLTVASGVITVTGQLHRVDTEGSGSTDDLVTINGGTGFKILYLRPNSSSRTIVLKHGTGNIKCFGNIDITLDDNHDFVVLLWDEANNTWCAMTDAGGGGGGGTTLPVADTNALVSDGTKLVGLDAGPVTAGQTRRIQSPDGDSRVRDVLTWLFAENPVNSNVYTGLVFPAAFHVESVQISANVTSVANAPVFQMIYNNSLFGATISVGPSASFGFINIAYARTTPDTTLVDAGLLQVRCDDNGAGSSGGACTDATLYIVGYYKHP